MTRILPLVGHTENRRLLIEWLTSETDYEIVDPTGAEVIDEPFDLCILDGLALHRHGDELQARKEGEHPVFLPYLILSSKRDVRYLDDDVWESIDGVIRQNVDEVISAAPISKFELKGRLRSLLRRRQTSLDLRESEEKHRSLTDDVLDSSDVGTFVLDSDHRVIWVNRAIERYFGVDRDALLERDRRDLVSEHADRFADSDLVAERLLAAYEDDTTVERFELHVTPGDEREERWLSHWSQPIESGLYAGGRVEHYADVTGRKERERMLRTLHRTTRRLMQAESKQEIHDVAVDAAAEIVNYPAVCLYQWNESRGVLSPGAHTPDAPDLFDDLEPFASGENPAWRAFVEGETCGYDDVTERETSDPEAAVRSEFVVPVDKHGVFVCGSTTTGVDDRDVEAVETLAANTKTALDRADREETLHAQEQQLQRQNEELSRLDRINTVIREIQQVLVRASTRQEIEQAVCRRLVDADPYLFAWIGARESTSDRISPRAWTGDESGYLDQLLGGNGSNATNHSLPAEKALHEREPQIVGNVLTDSTFEPWRQEALNAGYQSIISIPLLFNDTNYGVLEIYAGRPSEFSEKERAVLVELSETIANAINAVERTQAFFAEGKVELEFQIPDADDVLFRLARQAECPLDLDSILPQPNGSWVVYVTTWDVDPESILEVAERFVSVESGLVAGEEDDEYLLEIVVSDLALATFLGEHGATLHSLRVDQDGGRAVVHLPQTADVRSFVDLCTAQFPESELVARREGVRPETGHETSPGAIVNQLTDRQQEILQVAFHSGFFDWPREKTGEEVADTLDIAAPTFHQHVRKGLRGVLSAIFD